MTTSQTFDQSRHPRDPRGRFAPGPATEADVSLPAHDADREVDDVLDAVRSHAVADADAGEPWGGGDPGRWVFGESTRRAVAEQAERLRTEHPDDVAEFEAARPGRFARALADRLVGVEPGAMPTGFEDGTPGVGSPLDEAVEPLGTRVVRNTDGTVDLLG